MYPLRRPLSLFPQPLHAFMAQRLNVPMMFISKKIESTQHFKTPWGWCWKPPPWDTGAQTLQTCLLYPCTPQIWLWLHSPTIGTTHLVCSHPFLGVNHLELYPDTNLSVQTLNRVMHFENKKRQSSLRSFQKQWRLTFHLARNPCEQWQLLINQSLVAWCFRWVV